VNRWLYHVLRVEDDHGDPYTPRSLADEGFVHCSFQPEAAESARRYFPPDARIHALRIDPRPLVGLVVLADTPRGEFPHVHAAIPRSAIVERLEIVELAGAPDAIMT
jgi:uncharacterized protein (DUF952 family)